MRPIMINSIAKLIDLRFILAQTAMMIRQAVTLTIWKRKRAYSLNDLPMF